MSDTDLEFHYRTCPLCEATCGLEIAHRDGEIVRIRGDRDDPFSRGYICPKGTTLGKLFDDPDRLREPLVRRDGALVPATWDEAFAAVAEGLGRIWADDDRDAVALYLGNPNAHTVAGAIMGRPLIMALGTHNVYSASTVDQMAMHASAGHMFGNPMAIAVPDLDRTDYLLVLGANPMESNGSLCTAPDFPGRLDRLAERGGHLVVVDPRRTKTAQRADEHLAIRPGTDALWLAALVTEIAAANRVDLGAVERFVNGLAETIEALAPFTATSVADATGIAAETTRRIARELCDAPTAACYSRIGAQTTPYGTLASWLTDVVSLVTGNLDSPGGAMFPRAAIAAPAEPEPRPGRGFRTGRWHSRVKGHPEVRGELPVSTLADEIEVPGRGQVRGLITVAGNPALSCPNSDRLDAALAGLDFMVSVDIYLNETTRHADVILPPPSALAKQHMDLAFMSFSIRNYVNFSPPMHPVDAPGEPGMAEHEILARLSLIASGLGSDADPIVIYDLVLDQLRYALGRGWSAHHRNRSRGSDAGHHAPERQLLRHEPRTPAEHPPRSRSRGSDPESGGRSADRECHDRGRLPTSPRRSDPSGGVSGRGA